MLVLWQLFTLSCCNSALPYIYLANFILQLVKLLESKEVNHIEFCRIKNVLDEIMLMNGNAELSAIQDKLLEPASVVTGLRVDADILVSLVRYS